MPMYDPPNCAICGGPFSHIELLDFSALGEDEQYLKETAYNSQLLAAEQTKWIGYFRILARSDNNGIFSAKSQSSNEHIYVSAEGEWHEDEYWFEKAPGWADAAAGDETDQVYTRYLKYLTIHGACMILLQRFTEYQSKSPLQHLPTTLQEFIDTCVARQSEGTNPHGRFQASGQGPLPSNWASFQNVEHSHLYFGARRFWSDPWDCEPGFEHLCADPITKSGAEAFISTCLARPQSSLPLGHPLPEKTFMRLPQEIFDLIISPLSLRDALSLCSVSRNLVTRSDKEFWRFQTMRLHSCWLWELRDYPSTSSNVNWRALLQVLETHRFRIQAGAELYWLSTAASENDQMKHGSRRGAETSLVPIPLGLRNRQRIWRCLESVGGKAQP